MARADTALSALKYQVSKFCTHVNNTYTGGAGDVSTNYVFHIEPFDESDAASFSPTLGSSNYSFIITRFTTEATPDYPAGWLRQKYDADILIVRKTLRTKDRTNDRNLLQFGGTNDAGGTVTSIERLASDLQKWFRVITQGGKLIDAAATEHAFKCDILDIGELTKSGDFYFKLCKFTALSMESTTISAT